MKSEKLMSIAAIALLVALAIPVSLAAQDNWHNKNGKIITFNAPGAGTGSGQGTFDFFLDVLNELGAITGYYVDANNVSHGYVRAPNGAITTFNVKGAGTSSGQGTWPQNITDLWAIPGYYIDSNGVSHGFLRAPDGNITTFNVKGAGSGQGTFTDASNQWCEITGWYIDANGVYHGFLRLP